MEPKWYTEFRGFPKNFWQSIILKEKPDVKKRPSSKSEPEMLKMYNVMYNIWTFLIQICYRRSTTKLEIFVGKKYYQFGAQKI